MTGSSLKVTSAELQGIFQQKYGRDPSAMQWGPGTRARFRYFTPDEHYEAVVSRLVTAGCAWLDVGSGRNVFPGNRPLAQTLARRCGLLVGVDPDETIMENDLVHEHAKLAIEDFQSDRTFDLVTLRMVAEHIVDPDRAVGTLARLTKPGARVVIYTVDRWSPVPIITWLVPFRLHHLPKRLLWKADARDTFPVAYRMNTRRALSQILDRHGFQESEFGYLDDCRAFARFRTMLNVELCAWRCLHALGVRYPEQCLLGLYERV